MTKPFFDRLAMIDLAIEAGPEACDFRRDVKKYLEEEASRAYFYDNLKDARWLEVLSHENEFSEPPRAQHDPKTGAISFPPWPQARFLARMAPQAPYKVLEIILQIHETDNVRVYEDLVDAALEFPPRLATKLIPQILSWIESPYQMLLPEKLGKLMATMATIGEVDAAINLARKLLGILPDPNAIEESSVHEELRPSPDPRPRFDLWEYEEIVKKHFPVVLMAAPMPAFELLCNLLEDAVSLSQYSTEKKGPEDYSYIWRSAIEDHSQDLGLGLRNVLISSVRDAAEQLVRTDSIDITVLVGILESRPWRIFHRLALHILRIFPRSAPELIAERLTDRERFKELALRHEYYLLVRECFGHLPPEQQRKILNWIEEGPDISRLKDTDAEFKAEEDAKHYVKLWQRDRLEPIKENLDKEWRERYNKLVEELGPAEHPEFVSVTTSWVGPISPIEADDLKSMKIEEIVSFLKSWQATGEPMSPSPQGLGRTLTSVVASNPERFATKAHYFQGIDPTYVRGVLDGLREAAKQKKEDKGFQWLSVLELCSWVLKQSREPAELDTQFRDRDHGWRSSRQAIADLISSGFESEPSEIPIHLRNKVWEVLHPLTLDPEPTPEYESRYGGSNMDPATLSINTVRGEAMHAVIRYALWIRRHMEKADDSKERLARGLTEMPEVRETLDLHLDPKHDPALAIRSVYGRWFPWLSLLDRGWAIEKTHLIFPTEKEIDDRRDAAWETYITFCTAYNDILAILHEQYGLAIQRLGERKPERKFIGDPEERLAEHLMTFYWRGKFSLEDPENLIAEFYRKASLDLRQHALEFVGKSLKRSDAPVPPDILDRLKRLWNWRLFAVRVEEPALAAKELKVFGWWFSSGKLEDNWAIEGLKEALKLSGSVEPYHEVIRKLAQLADKMPIQTVECLDMLNEGDTKGLHIHARREDIRRILNVAIQRGGAAQKAAVPLVHRLGTRGTGFLDFRELLPES